jgi:hypothetical protein
MANGSIRLNMSKAEAVALLRVLNAKLPQTLQEIKHTDYSFEMRDFLRRNYANLEHVRNMLAELCEREGCAEVRISVGEEEKGKQARSGSPGGNGEERIEPH